MSTQEKNLVKITGKVIHLDFEGGFWGIEGDDGKKYRPQNLPKKAQKAGQRITAELEIVPSFSIMMWGIEVKIHKIETT